MRLLVLATGVHEFEKRRTEWAAIAPPHTHTRKRAHTHTHTHSHALAPATRHWFALVALRARAWVSAPDLPAIAQRKSQSDTG